MRLEICPAADRFSSAVRCISIEKHAVQKKNYGSGIYTV